MLRRSFLAVLGGAGVPHRPCAILHAIAAPQLPASLTLRASFAPGTILELRRYRTAKATELKALLQPVISVRAFDTLVCWTAFQDLERRDQAWCELNQSPAWRQLREYASLTHLSLWMVA